MLGGSGTGPEKRLPGQEQRNGWKLTRWGAGEREAEQGKGQAQRPCSDRKPGRYGSPKGGGLVSGVKPVQKVGEAG